MGFARPLQGISRIAVISVVLLSRVAISNKLSQERRDSGGWRGYERDGITSTCFDSLLNGDEEGVDCGGSCLPCPTCTDGIQNGDESGIDCGVACQLMCRWPRSCLEMLMDQPSLPSGNYTIYPWQHENEEGAPRSSWRPDTIRPIPAEVGVRVYCDMETDGGGYTFHTIDEGIDTSNHTAPNSCHEVGMNIVVPRSKAHWESMLNLTGVEYFSLVPGIYKPSSGGDYGTYAMNSANVPNWVAVDLGSWWLSDIPTGEPSGDYLPECWLSLNDWNISTTGLRFNDLAINGTDTCLYSSTNYVCSTNDKDFPSHIGQNLATNGFPEPNWPLVVTGADSFALSSAQLLNRPPPYHISLSRNTRVTEYTMVISTGKTVHFISHPEACGGGIPGLKNTGVNADAHVHHACQYTLSGIRSDMSDPGSDQYHTGHTDGSLGGFFDIQPNGTLIIEDLILQRSVQERGGAIRINHGSLEVVNCQFRGNTAVSFGGAIFSFVSDIYLLNSSFEFNEALSGGAIYNERGVLSVMNVTFDNNTAVERNGGSIYNAMGESTIQNATFSGNRAKSGGAIYSDEAELLVKDSFFFENEADWNGGALYNHYGNAELDACVMTDNLVHLKGGAVYNHYGHIGMVESHFYCNLARWESYGYGSLPITKFLGRRAVEINDLDRAGNAVYHRYTDEHGPVDSSAELARINLALHRPTYYSSSYTAGNWSGLAVDGDTTSREPPFIFISSNTQPSWWGVQLSSPTTNPQIKFYASDCCSPEYKRWAYSPQAGAAGTDSIVARQHGDFGQTFDCCTADYGKRLDFYIGYEPDWGSGGLPLPFSNHCGAITSVADGGSYSTRCVGQGNYIIVTGGSTSDGGWLAIAEVEVIGVANNWTSVKKVVTMEEEQSAADPITDLYGEAPGRLVEKVSYEPSSFDCNNWFGKQPGIQFTTETVNAHDLAKCSRSIAIDANTTFDFGYFATLYNLSNSTGQAIDIDGDGDIDLLTACKFSHGTRSTPQDVVLDVGGRSAPVAAELRARMKMKGRTDAVLDSIRLGGGGGHRRQLAAADEEDGGEDEDGGFGRRSNTKMQSSKPMRGKDDVFRWLQTLRLERLRAPLAAVGVEVIADLRHLQAPELASLRLNKLEKRRLVASIKEVLKPPAAGSTVWEQLSGDGSAAKFGAAALEAEVLKFFDGPTAQDLPAQAGGEARAGAGVPPQNDAATGNWWDQAASEEEQLVAAAVAGSQEPVVTAGRPAAAEAAFGGDEGHELRCVGWKQTLGCDPAGLVDDGGSAGCNALIRQGRSGYCECEGGVRARPVNCDHAAFTCHAACSVVNAPPPAVPPAVVPGANESSRPKLQTTVPVAARHTADDAAPDPLAHRSSLKSPVDRLLNALYKAKNK